MSKIELDAENVKKIEDILALFSNDSMSAKKALEALFDLAKEKKK